MSDVLAEGGPHCRCDTCELRRDRTELLRALMNIIGDGGASGGVHYKCRCEACADARAVVISMVGVL